MSYSQGELQEGQEVSQHQESSEFITPKHSCRKELCDVCQTALYKYTCPRCRVKSCGVGCLNRHKKNSGCTGVANPFPQLHSKQIEQKQVEKDYLFVKEMLSSADKVKRTLTGVETLSQEPKRFKIMRINAKKLYNITILNAPSIIERHRQNISFYFVKTKTFYWVIELLYWRNAKAVSRVVTQPEPDSKTVIDLLPEDYLCRDLLQSGINTQKKEEMHVFLEKKGRQSGRKEAVEVEKIIPLRDALINHTIYEFPTLVIVHQSLVSAYLSYRQSQKKNE